MSIALFFVGEAVERRFKTLEKHPSLKGDFG